MATSKDGSLYSKHACHTPSTRRAKGATRLTLSAPRSARARTPYCGATSHIPASLPNQHYPHPDLPKQHTYTSARAPNPHRPSSSLHQQATFQFLQSARVSAWGEMEAQRPQAAQPTTPRFPPDFPPLLLKYIHDFIQHFLQYFLHLEENLEENVGGFCFSSKIFLQKYLHMEENMEEIFGGIFGRKFSKRFPPKFPPKFSSKTFPPKKKFPPFEKWMNLKSLEEILEETILGGGGTN